MLNVQQQQQQLQQMLLLLLFVLSLAQLSLRCPASGTVHGCASTKRSRQRRLSFGD
jgi:hypothetical protein